MQSIKNAIVLFVNQSSAFTQKHTFKATDTRYEKLSSRSLQGLNKSFLGIKRVLGFVNAYIGILFSTMCMNTTFNSLLKLFSLHYRKEVKNKAI